MTLSPRLPPRPFDRAALQAAGAGRWRVAAGRLHLDAAARRLLGDAAARQSWARWRARRTPEEAAALAVPGEVALTLDCGTRRVLLRGRLHARGGEGLVLEAPPADGAFVAAVAHELRTPLNAISGFARMALADAAGTPAARHLAPIESAAQLMRRVVDDLLDLAALDAGRLALQADRPLDLAALVARVGAAGAPLREARPVALYALLDGPCPGGLRGDPGRLEQVLLNLLANALKFTPRGRVVLAVKTRRQDEQHATLRFSVADTGAGIALEALPRLGRPFERAGGAAPGSGLGLAVVQRLLQQMGSSLRIASVDGGGTMAWFELRLARDAAAPAPPPRTGWALFSDDRLFRASVATQWQAHGHALAAHARRWLVDTAAPGAEGFIADRRAQGDQVVPASAGPGRHTLVLLAAELLAAPPPAPVLPPGLRVLVVDDNTLNQHVLADFLQRAGAQPVIAGSTAAALARLGAEHFDVALVDLRLDSGPGGLDLVRAMRDTPGGARLPFALLSAHVSAAERAQAAALGALACLDKPFDPDTLLAVLRRAVAPPQPPHPPHPLRALFAREWPAQRAALAGAVDAAALRERVHALRGSLAVLGAAGALALARQVEEGLAAGQPPAALPLAALLASADALAALPG